MRSLSIILKDGTEISAIGGTGFASIAFPCTGTVDNNGNHNSYEILVKVDGKNDNLSFNVETFNEWFDYRIQRIGGLAKILINVNQNTDTFKRFAELVIKHNSSNLTIYIDIEQSESEYSITAKYANGYDGVFESFPKNGYEEKIVDVEAVGGSGKWYVKDVEQYEAFGNVEENEAMQDEIPEEWRVDENGKPKETRVEFDKALTYYINNDNRLIVTSFGRIDLSNTHMRYYFRIGHQNDIDTDTLLMFRFGNNQIRSYVDGVFELPAVNTFEQNYYVFEAKLNYGNVIKDEILIPYRGIELPLTIISTRNGMEIKYQYECDSEWCIYDKTKNTVTFLENPLYNKRECTMTLTQTQDKGKKKTIQMTFSQYEKPLPVVFNIYDYVDGKQKKLVYEKYTSYLGEEYVLFILHGRTNQLPMVKYEWELRVTKKDKEWLDFQISDNAINWRDFFDDPEVTKKSTDSQYLKIIVGKNDENRRVSDIVISSKSVSDGSIEPIYITINQEMSGVQYYNYTVKYVTDDGIILDTIYGRGEAGEQITVTAKEIKDYTLLDEKDKIIIISTNEAKNIATFTYTKASKYNSSYTIKYLADNGAIIRDDNVVPCFIDKEPGKLTISANGIDTYVQGWNLINIVPLELVLEKDQDPSQYIFTATYYRPTMFELTDEMGQRINEVHIDGSSGSKNNICRLYAYVATSDASGNVSYQRINSVYRSEMSSQDNYILVANFMPQTVEKDTPPYYNIMLTVKANDTGSPRDGIVKFKNNETDDEVMLLIIQDA